MKKLLIILLSLSSFSSFAFNCQQYTSGNVQSYSEISLNRDGSPSVDIFLELINVSNTNTDRSVFLTLDDLDTNLVHLQMLDIIKYAKENSLRVLLLIDSPNCLLSQDFVRGGSTRIDVENTLVSLILDDDFNSEQVED